MWPDRWKLEDLGEELAKAKEEAKEKVGHGKDMELYSYINYTDYLSKMRSEHSELDW